MSAVTSLASSNMENDKVRDKFPEGMKVLLVDDDLTCLTVVKRMLLNCKYDVTTCSEASMALSLLRENRGAFDLIISDVHMPDMDGFKLLELVGLEMDLPVIMMSGDTKFNVVMKGVSHGACDFLAKPVRMEELQNIWQHVVRRKWLDSKDVERSGSVEETEHNRQATDDSEYASTLNDGTDSSWKYQKKKRDAKEDDDGELESIDPSSSKKPRVVWSVELHQQFVNAVNQLGIDKAVPKRILELMSVPGLTRENVASHLQKFRLYLKRLSGVAQHQNGLNNTLCGASPNAKACQMGRLDYQALGISSQISPQTLAALQDELLGRPSRSLAMSATNQPIVQQASVQGNNCVNFERGITFGQPLLKGQTVPSFPVWSSNNFGAVGSGSNHLGVSAFPNSDMHMTMQPPQPQQQTLPSESNLAINVQPSCLVASRKSSGSFQVQRNSVLLNQESSVTPSRCSASYQAINAVVPVAQDSTSLKVVNHTYVSNPRSTMPPSQLLNGISVGNVPGIINEGSIVTSQPLNKSQTGTDSFLIDQNSMALPSQLSSTYQMQKNGGPINNHGPINNNSMINTGIAHVNFNSLPGQINAMPSGQMLDGIFDSSVMMGGYSVPVSKTSEVVSCSSNSTSWQLQSPEILTGHPNRSDCLVPPNTCNVQTTNSMLGKFHEKGYGKTLGFVGKGTCLPSRFAVDDNEPSTIELTNSGIYTGDDAYFLNQDIYGALQSGPCATTNFK